MITRIVIYHLKGSKQKQVEQFAVDAFSEISIGRAPGSTIRFYDARDDGVSLNHALIRVSGSPPRFLLSDCGSRNGTRLNGAPVAGEAEIFPGDEIELGGGGPKFVFDLQPGPTRLAVRTGTIGTPGEVAQPPAKATSNLPAVRPPAPEHRPAPDTGLVTYRAPPSRQAPGRRALYGLAGSLAVIVTVGALVYRAHRETAPDPPWPAAGSTALTAMPGSPAASNVPADAPRSAATPPTADSKVAAAIAPLPADAPAPARDRPAPTPPAATPPAATPELPAVPPEAKLAELLPQAAPAPEPAPTPTFTPPPRAKPDLAGTVRKIAGASRFEVHGQWIELFGIDDPTSRGEHNQTVYEYLKPFRGVIECYRKGKERFECFGGGQDLAIIAIHKGLVRLTPDAPAAYQALMGEAGDRPKAHRGYNGGDRS